MVTSRTSIIHILYDENTMDHDIALILLPSRIALTSEYCHILLYVKIVFLLMNNPGDAYIVVCYLFHV